MRQAGVIAAGALYALRHNVERLAEDHENARLLADYLRQIPGITIDHPVQTNIVIANVGLLGDGAKVVAVLREAGVLCGLAGPNRVRFVTHLDVSRDRVRKAGEIAARALRQLSRGER